MRLREKVDVTLKKVMAIDGRRKRFSTVTKTRKDEYTWLQSFGPIIILNASTQRRFKGGLDWDSGSAQPKHLSNFYSQAITQELDINKIK